jgi:hypothetical protein
MAGREPIVFSSLTASEIFIEVSSAAETKIEGDRRFATIPGSSPAGGVIIRARKTHLAGSSLARIARYEGPSERNRRSLATAAAALARHRSPRLWGAASQKYLSSMSHNVAAIRHVFRRLSKGDAKASRPAASFTALQPRNTILSVSGAFAE